MTQHELADLEEQGWQVLSSTGAAATGFYQRILDETVIMLLPGGMLLDDRKAIIKSMSAQPWSSYRLHDVRALQPAPDTGIVIYEVTAKRGGAPPFSANWAGPNEGNHSSTGLPANGLPSGRHGRAAGRCWPPGR